MRSKFARLTDLALSGRVPLNGSSATHRVALRKAARPPGQATARGPLQCRVGPPVQLPLVQIRVNRTIKNYYFRGSLLAPTVWAVAGSLPKHVKRAVATRPK